MMDLHAERARIDALPASHFQPLLDLLPQLRSELPQPPPWLRPEPDGTITYAPINVDAVYDFIKLCYAMPVIFPYDWNEFVREHPFHEFPRLIDRFDRFQCCQAITALVRGDRFSDGLLDMHWRNGNLARIVERLKEVLSKAD
jgi:hypothetical protein